VPSRVTPNNASATNLGKRFYLLVNGARKVKSNAQVALSKNSDSVQKFFRGGWEDSAPNSNFCTLLELFETNAARKLISGLPINIDKANSRRYHVIR